MTDLEMTRLCAEAMGIWHCSDTDTDFVGQPPLATVNTYNPLHDDAQAMALVKRFRLNIGQLSGGWCKVFTQPSENGIYEGESQELNRSIVECVAKMQESKQ